MKIALSSALALSVTAVSLKADRHAPLAQTDNETNVEAQIDSEYGYYSDYGSYGHPGAYTGDYGHPGRSIYGYPL